MLFIVIYYLCAHNGSVPTKRKSEGTEHKKEKEKEKKGSFVFCSLILSLHLPLLNRV
jgi:hypothetical protein